MDPAARAILPVWSWDDVFTAQPLPYHFFGNDYGEQEKAADIPKVRVL